MKKNFVASMVAGISFFAATACANPAFEISVETQGTGAAGDLPAVTVEDGDILFARCRYADADAVLVVMPIDGKDGGELSMHLVDTKGNTLIDEISAPIGAKASVPVDGSVAFSVSSRRIAEE